MAKQKGFSLVETAIILGVAGIVLGGLWVSIGTIRTKANQSQVATDLAYSVMNFKDFFRNSAAIATPTGVKTGPSLTSYALEQGLIPPELLRSRSLVGGVYLADHSAVDKRWVSANPLSGSFVVRSDVGDAGYQFLVDVKGLNQAACIFLGAKLSGSDAGVPAPLSTKVNATTYFVPVTPEQADAACADNFNNEVTLTYRLRDNM